MRFRCVAIYNAELGQWHRYITNMPPEIMRAEHITAVYAARRARDAAPREHGA